MSHVRQKFVMSCPSLFACVLTPQKTQSKRQKQSKFKTDPGGLEHHSYSQGKSRFLQPVGAKSGALFETSRDSTPPLTKIDRLIQAWPRIPPHVQETILTLVDATVEDDCVKRHQLSTIVARKSSEHEHASPDALRRFLLRALRHRPDLYGLELDADGWCNLSNLVKIVRQHFEIAPRWSPDKVLQLIEGIDTFDRLQLKGKKMRAAYGHSFPGFAPTTDAVPREPLFHGTDASLWTSINAGGLLPATRRFVQLTTDFDYAEKVARRRKQKPLILQVMTREAVHQGVRFFETGTHVWQATEIPSDCLQLWASDPMIADDWYDSAMSFEADLPLFSSTHIDGGRPDADDHF